MQGRTLIIFTAVQIFVAGVFFWVVFTRPGPWDWQRGLGVLLAIVGVAGGATARYQLGISFSITPQARQLVTHGVYSRIRNPIYVFGTIAIAGFIMAMRRPAWWPVLIAIVIMQMFRAHREAQVLEAKFGDAYREYRRNTWF
ncbi:MAG: methyltransferase family protein [Candidatus Sulfotelmatobacter sp.]